MAWDPAVEQFAVSDYAQGTLSLLSAGPTTYLLTVNETGLTTSQVWSLNVSGELPVLTATTSAWINLTNGTYSYSIGTPNSIYHPTLAGGTLQVEGGAVREEVVFVPTTYTLGFVESGLPPGTSWSVVLNGVFLSSTTPSIEFAQMTNGSYGYVVDPVRGYVASPSNSSVRVDGPPAGTIPVSFQPPPGAVGPSPGSQTETLVAELLGIVAAVAVLISWAVWRQRRRKPDPDWFKAP